MRNLWLIARKEFVVRARSGAYIASTLMMMLVLLGTTLAPSLIENQQKTEPLRLLVQDRTGAVAEPYREALEAAEAQGGRPVAVEIAEGPEGELLDRIESDGGALLVVEGDFPDGLKARLLSTSPSVLTTAGDVLAPLESIVRQARMARRGVDPALTEVVLHPLEIETRQVTADGAERDSDAFLASLLTGLGLVFSLYLVVLMNGTFVFQGVLEEKISRVVEVMASAVGPRQMLAGKVIGLGALGLAQFLCMLVAWLGGNLISRQISGVAAAPVRPDVALLALLFLVLGYVQAATLMAAAASTISRMEDSQTLMMPFSLILAVPMIMIAVLINNPNGTVATVLSLIPLFSPPVMVLRVVLGSVPGWQVALSVALLVLSAAFMTWAGGRVYKAAMLSYGGRPSLRQIWQYLRAG